MQSTKAALMLATLLTATASANSLNELNDMQLNEDQQACLCETMCDPNGSLEAAINDCAGMEPTDLPEGGLEEAGEDGSECYRRKYPYY